MSSSAPEWLHLCRTSAEKAHSISRLILNTRTWCSCFKYSKQRSWESQRPSLIGWQLECRYPNKPLNHWKFHQPAEVLSICRNLFSQQRDLMLFIIFGNNDDKCECAEGWILNQSILLCQLVFYLIANTPRWDVADNACLCRNRRNASPLPYRYRRREVL